MKECKLLYKDNLSKFVFIFIGLFLLLWLNGVFLFLFYWKEYLFYYFVILSIL